jgi:hypothetical protein
MFLEHPQYVLFPILFPQVAECVEIEPCLLLLLIEDLMLGHHVETHFVQPHILPQLCVLILILLVTLIHPPLNFGLLLSRFLFFFSLPFHDFLYLLLNI